MRSGSVFLALTVGGLVGGAGIGACQKPASPPPASPATAPPAPSAGFAGPDEPAVVTAERQRLPLGRWADFNAGNYVWVFRMDGGQAFRVSGRSEDATSARLELWSVHLDSDVEWDEADIEAKLPIDAGADGIASGVLPLLPKANAGRIRISGRGRVGVKIEEVGAPPPPPSPPSPSSPSR